MNKIGKITLSAPPKNKLSDLLNDCKAGKGESLPLKSGLKVATSIFRKCSLQQGRFCFVNDSNVPAENKSVCFLSCIANNKVFHTINKDHLENAIIVLSARSLTVTNWLLDKVHYKQNAS